MKHTGYDDIQRPIFLPAKQARKKGGGEKKNDGRGKES
jgi:hypothetical protein